MVFAEGGRWTPSLSLLTVLTLVTGALVVLAVLRGWQPWGTQLIAAGFVLLLAPLGLAGAGSGSPVLRVLAWLAGLTFVFFLAHSPWAKHVIPALTARGVTSGWVLYAACLAVAFVVSLFFWASFTFAAGLLARRRSKAEATSSS